MAAALTASFILKLEDQLSSGIAALSQRLEALARLGKQVQLSGLNGADRALDKLGAGADAASRRVGGISRAARQATEDINRLNNSIRVNAAGVATVPPSLARANAGAAIAAIAVAAGGRGAGGGGAGGGGSVPFAGGPSPLLLGGPSGGGIPIQGINGWTRGLLGFGGAAQATGARVAGLARQVQSVSRHTRELGEAGLKAFATGFGMEHVIGEYARYENTLRHIAITANTPKEMIPGVVRELSRQYDRLALASGQSSEKISEAAQFLITTGIGRENVDKLIPLVARASTAYNTDIGESVQAIFSLKENLHVDDKDIAGTISAAALAGKEGHFSFGDFSRYLPDIAPLAAGAGLKGSAGARDLMAMLETSRRNAGTAGEAETNLRDFLSHLFGGEKRGLAHEFKQGYGVDLGKLLRDAEKRGINAPDAVIAQVSKMVQGKTEVEKSQIIGNLFHNIQAANYVRAAINDAEYLLRLRQKLAGADDKTIDHDFDKAADAPLVKMRQLQERLVQIERRLGEGFVPVLDVLNGVLDKVLGAMDRLDQVSPGTVNKVLGWVAGFLGVAVALGLLIPLFKLAVSGVALFWNALVGIGRVAALLGAPFEVSGAVVLGVIAAIALAAYEVYQHWDAVKAWFQQLWGNVVQIFHGAYEVIAGLCTGDMSRVVAGLWAVWGGLQGLFETLWAGVRGAFTTFVAWVDSWTDGAATAVIDKIKAAWNELAGFFSKLWDDATGPFNRMIASIEEKIGALRALLGLGPSDPNGDGHSQAHPALPAPGAPIPGLGLGGMMPTAYHPSGAGASPLDIRIRVDQDGRVTGVGATSNDRDVRPRVDRGDMARRA